MSPNVGESLAVGTPYTITWNQNGLVRPSVALYQHDKWVKWLATSINQSSFTWTPTAEDVSRSGGSDYKIYVTAEKLDGTGYVDDKSDTPFVVTAGPVATLPQVQTGVLSSSVIMSTALTFDVLYRTLQQLLTHLR